MLRIILAALHLLALGIGLGSALQRGVSLREPPSAASLRRVMRADMMWGVAAFLWIGTGLWRWIGETEKVAAYYVHNTAFLVKIALFLVIFALEIWPMVTLMRWRAALGRGGSAEAVAVPATARRIATISHLQAGLVTVMVFLAVAMARGFGARD